MKRNKTREPAEFVRQSVNKEKQSAEFVRRTVNKEEESAEYARQNKQNSKQSRSLQDLPDRTEESAEFVRKKVDKTEGSPKFVRHTVNKEEGSARFADGIWKARGSGRRACSGSLHPNIYRRNKRGQLTKITHDNIGSLAEIWHDAGHLLYPQEGSYLPRYLDGIGFNHILRVSS